MAELDGDAFWRRLGDAFARVPEQARTPPPDARVGAVLALFEETPRGPLIVLTRRRRDLRSHPGQLSFPGGRVDPGESFEQAALREAQEEIGLDPASVEIVGTGPTFFIPPSRFWVVPLAGRWVAPHELNPNPWEVDAILRVPLASLLEPERWRTVPMSERGPMWAWDLDDDLLWGATAVMIATLLDVVVGDWSGGLAPEDLPVDREVRPWEHFPTPPPRVRLEGVPEVAQDTVPHVTGEQVREIVRVLDERAGLDLGALAEQAGRAAMNVLRRLVGDDLSGVRVRVLVGPGGTGAAGLAAARLLAVAGASVAAVLLGEPRLRGQVDALLLAGGSADRFDPGTDPGDVVLDAMLGCGVEPPVRDEVADAIAWLRTYDRAVVALDLPSGVHPDRGLVGPCVGADVTVAFGAPKVAHAQRRTRPYVGDLYLADLGVPAAVWREVGVEPPDVFARGSLVRLVPPVVASD